MNIEATNNIKLSVIKLESPVEGAFIVGTAVGTAVGAVVALVLSVRRYLKPTVL